MLIMQRSMRRHFISMNMPLTISYMLSSVSATPTLLLVYGSEYEVGVTVTT